MFHHKFLESCRHELRDVENIHLIPTDQWSDAVAQAHAQAGVALPAGVEIAPGKVGAPFDGHLIKRLRAWFDSPNGKAFLAILKKIAIALIIGIISGS